MYKKIICIYIAPPHLIILELAEHGHIRSLFLISYRLTKSSQDITTLLVRSGFIDLHLVTSVGLARALESSPLLHGRLWLEWCCEQVIQAVPANKREQWKRNKHKQTEETVENRN